MEKQNPLEHVCYACFTDSGWSSIKSGINTAYRRNLYDAVHQAIINVAADNNTDIFVMETEKIVSLVAREAARIKAVMDRKDGKSGMRATSGRMHVAFGGRVSLEREYDSVAEEIEFRDDGIRITEEEYELKCLPNNDEDCRAQEGIETLMSALDSYLPGAHETAVAIFNENPDVDFLGGIASALAREMDVHRRTAQRRIAAFREYCLTNNEARSALKAVLGM